MHSCSLPCPEAVFWSRAASLPPPSVWPSCISFLPPFRLTSFPRRRDFFFPCAADFYEYRYALFSPHRSGSRAGPVSFLRRCPIVPKGGFSFRSRCLGNSYFPFSPNGRLFSRDFSPRDRVRDRPPFLLEASRLTTGGPPPSLPPDDSMLASNVIRVPCPFSLPRTRFGCKLNFPSGVVQPLLSV